MRRANALEPNECRTHCIERERAIKKTLQLTVGAAHRGCVTNSEQVYVLYANYE